MSTQQIRVLVIDDSSLDQELVRRRLMRCEKATFEVVTADSAKDGLKAIQEMVFDVVLVDYTMPIENGMTVLRGLGAKHSPPVIMLTGREDGAIVQEAMRLGAAAHASKSLITSDAIADLCIRTFNDSVRSISLRAS